MIQDVYRSQRKVLNLYRKIQPYLIRLISEMLKPMSNLLLYNPVLLAEKVLQVHQNQSAQQREDNNLSFANLQHQSGYIPITVSRYFCNSGQSSVLVIFMVVLREYIFNFYSGVSRA